MDKNWSIDPLSYEAGSFVYGDTATLSDNLTLHMQLDSTRLDDKKAYLSKWVIFSSLAILIIGLLVVAGCTVVTCMRYSRRRKYIELEKHQRQMMAISQLLEELRGRSRRVATFEPLTESEKHFLRHDFADYY